ncbi:MAG: hypothetical protein UY63_C0004G0007 [Parcubacteria group bacterium GW2011_GWA2_51_10]|nr:MAG: hypothetical protein UY63_C0004G0007 [Parcubacteria group bacterium GW2011_GWA2_51_10]
MSLDNKKPVDLRRRGLVAALGGALMAGPARGGEKSKSEDDRFFEAMERDIEKQARSNPEFVKEMFVRHRGDLIGDATNVENLKRMLRSSKFQHVRSLIAADVIFREREIAWKRRYVGLLEKYLPPEVPRDKGRRITTQTQAPRPDLSELPPEKRQKIM